MRVLRFDALCQLVSCHLRRILDPLSVEARDGARMEVDCVRGGPVSLGRASILFEPIRFHRGGNPERRYLQSRRFGWSQISMAGITIPHFGKLRREWDRQFEDPDDVYLKAEQRGEERRKQGLPPRLGIIPHEAIAVEETRLEAKQGRKNRRRTKAKK